MDSLWRGTMLALIWTAAAAVVAFAGVVLFTFPDLPVESLLLGGGAAIVVGAGVAAGFAWGTTRPLRQFLAHTQDILDSRDASPELRIAPQDQEAFYPLVTGINTLMEQIEEDRRDLQAAQRERDLDKAEWSEKLRETREHFETQQQRRDGFLNHWRDSLTELADRIQQSADRLLDIRLAPNERFDRVETIRRASALWRERFTAIADLCTADTQSASSESVEGSPSDSKSAPCDTVQLVDAVLQPVWREARQRGIPIEFSCDTPLPSRLDAAAAPLAQTLRHLSLAAFELSDGQALSMVVRWTDSKESQISGLRFRIVGCGEQLASLADEAVFDPYGAAENEQDPLPPAARLALATASRLARQFHWHVEIGRQASGHSALVLAVPCTLADNTPMIPAPDLLCGQGSWQLDAHGTSHTISRDVEATALRGNILIAASDQSLAEGLSQMLSAAGADVVTVADGAAAYAKAISTEEQAKPFDVILLDDPLAELDVPAAASRLRHGGFNGLILALSHAPVPGQIQNAQRDWVGAGCDDVLLKPLDTPALFGLLRRLVPPAKNPVAATPVNVSPFAGDEPDQNNSKHQAPSRPVESKALVPVGDPASPIGAEAERFVGDLQRWVNKLDQALGDGDMVSLASVASQTRNAAGFWGLRTLVEAAERLQVCSQQSAGLESLVDCVEKLSSLCRDVIDTRPSTTRPSTTRT